MWLKNWNGDETPKLKWLLYSKTKIVMKLKKNSKCDEYQKLELWWKSKTLIVTKLKNPMETNLKLWQNSISQIVINLKFEIMTKVKRKLNDDKTIKHKYQFMKNKKNFKRFF